MKKTLRDQIDELAAMGVAELEQQHRKLFGEEPASAARQFLFRKIAWRLQADREGCLPEPARELARAIAKDAPLRNRVISNAGKRPAGFPIEQSATTTITPDHDARLPMPGGLIVKHFKDQTIIVKVSRRWLPVRRSAVRFVERHRAGDHRYQVERLLVLRIDEGERAWPPLTSRFRLA